MTTSNRHRYFRIAFVTFILLLFVYLFSPFFPAIVLAILFAFALEKPVRNFSQRQSRRRWMTVGLLTSLFLLIAIPVVIVIVKAISSVKKYADVGLQNSSLYQSTEKLFTSLSGKASAVAQSLNVDLSELPQSSDLLRRAAAMIGPLATAFFGALPEIVLGLFVFALFLYYLLTESQKIKKSIMNLDLMTDHEMDQLIEATQKSSYIALVASAIIGCVQAGLLATVAYFVGYTEFLMIFVITFIFSLIPVIGAAPVAIFLSLISFIQGDNGIAIGMLVTATVVGTIDNAIKPFIINSSNDNLHPVIALLSLIGAIMAFGAPGLIIGPVVTDLAFKVVDIFFPTQKV
ncbi:MAG: AI-2E family transporter [Bdellovibrionaceae bacterium]|nr:AI-2E family transporter [Bdellovibrio sp.]